MKVISFLTLLALLGCSNNTKSSANDDRVSGTKDTCEGTKGELVGASLSKGGRAPASPVDTSADSRIASIDIVGDTKLGKLFCITITLLDANGKPVAAKAGGQTLTFSEREFGPGDDRDSNNVRLTQLNRENGTMIFGARHTSVPEGESSVALSNLFTFDNGKIEVAAGTIKGSVNLGVIDNPIGVASLTFTDAGTDKLAIRLQQGKTIDAGYDAYFVNDNSGEVIPAAEGDMARPVLDDTEKHITFSKDVDGDNHVFIFYGEDNNLITGGEAVCPHDASGQQVCPEHVRN